jgi:alpha-L-fucosidase
MIELVLIFILSISTSLFLYLYLKQKKANNYIVANTIKLLLHKEIEHKENKTDKEKANEDFLKFVSDSRDWAYQYIEDVQASLNKFISDLEPEIAYFDEYGIVGSAFPHYHSMKKISGAYKELKKLLPEDYDRIG